MQILKATIVKDVKILLRDRVGLFIMFFMPILLVIIITSVQNSTFELINNNKISLLVYNKDSGDRGVQLVEAIRKIGLFKMQLSDSLSPSHDITAQMYKNDALVALVIPASFSSFIQNKADDIASHALRDSDSAEVKKDKLPVLPDSLLMYYHPVMQPSFRQSIEGTLRSSVQVIQGEAIVQKLYIEANQKAIPPDLEKE